jgi:hypothetical protein
MPVASSSPSLGKTTGVILLRKAVVKQREPLVSLVGVESWTDSRVNVQTKSGCLTSVVDGSAQKNDGEGEKDDNLACVGPQSWGSQ